MLKRFLPLIRLHSEKLPSKIEDLKLNEKKALQDIHDENIELGKKKISDWFPDPNVPVDRKQYPMYPSAYGPSDEEDTPAFFLEDLKDYQYIYTPKVALDFADSDFCMIFQAKSRYFFYPSKLRYSWKIIFPVFLSVAITFQAAAHATAVIVFSWALPLVILTRALMVKQIFLHKDGKKIKVLCKRFKFGRTLEKTINIKDFKEPSGDAFLIWSLYEFPDDLKTFNENPNIERIAFAKYWGWWSFFVLPKHPEIINREVLVNALNGIYIDTKQTGGEDLKSRYFILEKKQGSQSNVS